MPPQNKSSRLTESWLLRTPLTPTAHRPALRLTVTGGSLHQSLELLEAVDFHYHPDEGEPH